MSKRALLTHSGRKWRKMPFLRSSAGKTTKIGWQRMAFQSKESMEWALEPISLKHKWRRYIKNKQYFDKSMLFIILLSLLYNRVFILFANRLKTTLTIDGPTLADVLSVTIESAEYQYLILGCCRWVTGNSPKLSEAYLERMRQCCWDSSISHHSKVDSSRSHMSLNTF